MKRQKHDEKTFGGAMRKYFAIIHDDDWIKIRESHDVKLIKSLVIEKLRKVKNFPMMNFASPLEKGKEIIARYPMLVTGIVGPVDTDIKGMIVSKPGILLKRTHDNCFNFYGDKAIVFTPEGIFLCHCC